MIGLIILFCPSPFSIIDGSRNPSIREHSSDTTFSESVLSYTKKEGGGQACSGALRGGFWHRWGGEWWVESVMCTTSKTKAWLRLVSKKYLLLQCWHYLEWYTHSLSLWAIQSRLANIYCYWCTWYCPPSSRCPQKEGYSSLPLPQQAILTVGIHNKDTVKAPERWPLKQLKARHSIIQLT